MSFYAASMPSQPSALIKGERSSRTQIEVVWAVQPDNDIAVSGYILEADLDHCGKFVEIWNGRNHPEITRYLLTQVVTGLSYDFRYKTLNQNGESEYSEILTVWACELPTKPTSPTWVTSSETSIIIEWESPLDDGGCSVREYRVYRD